MRKTKTKDKTLFNRDGKPFVSRITTTQFKRTRYVKKSKDLEAAFDQEISPQFRKFYERNQKRHGNLFLFKIETRHNFKGRRIKSGFSDSRTKITSKKGLEKALKAWKKKFLESMEKYLSRKDATSMSISGVKMEVVKRAKKSQAARKRRKTKKK